MVERQTKERKQKDVNTKLSGTHTHTHIADAHTRAWVQSAAPGPSQTSHQTNLIFFRSTELFRCLFLAEVLAGRSLRRLSLLWDMVNPNLLTTITSSLPPISTVLRLSGNYSPALVLALRGSGGQKTHKAAALICARLQEVMLQTLCAESYGRNAERGVTQDIIHSRPLPSHSQVTLPDCSTSGIRLKQDNSGLFDDATSYVFLSCPVNLMIKPVAFFFFYFHSSVQTPAPPYGRSSERAELLQPINQGAFVDKKTRHVLTSFYSQVLI